MKALRIGAVLCASLTALAAAGVAAAGKTEHFQARHEAVIKDIPTGARKARVWLVVPRQDPAQKVGEIRLEGPGGAVHQGGTYNNRYAYFEIDNPPATFKVAADFAVERQEVRTEPSPEKVRPLSDRAKARMAAELEANKYVPVNDQYRALALKAVGDERNPVRQASKIYDWVLEYVEYWVKDPATKKASPNGESDYCLATKTGNCTDFHSLYASLTRSIGIPTRIVYGSFFQGENTPIPNKATLEGKDTDGSYHCWIEFFTPGNGWTPLDVALADLLPTTAEQRYYFGNLDGRRVTWSYGRDLTLAPKQDGPPVNAMHKVYVEVDGKAHAAWDRKLTYRAGK